MDKLKRNLKSTKSEVENRKASSILIEYAPDLQSKEIEMLLSFLKGFFKEELKSKNDFISWLRSKDGVKYFKMAERIAFDGRKIIDFSLHPKFANELELLFGTEEKFTTDEKIDIIKRLIEITTLALNSASNDSIHDKFKDIAEKYRDRYKINFSGYFYDEILFEKAVGDGKYDYYTQQEYENIPAGLHQITEDQHKFFLQYRALPYLNNELWRFLGQPSKLQSSGERPLGKIQGNKGERRPSTLKKYKTLFDEFNHLATVENLSHEDAAKQIMKKHSISQKTLDRAIKDS